MTTEAVKIPVKKPEALPSAETSSTVVGRLAHRYGINAQKLMGTLRDTLFIPPKGEQPFSESEMAAALIIAEKYELDPFTKEIHVTRSNGRLLVIVGIDGWIRVVNREPRFDGMDVQIHEGNEGPHACTCTIWVKGRSRPTVITEYFEEVNNPGNNPRSPWRSHPRRMLRHKAIIQCARIAFGISGLVDDDEAQRIIAAEAHVVDSRQLDAPEPQKYLADAVRIPERIARQPEVEAEVEAAHLPADVPLAEERREPVVDSREEPARAQEENEEPGGNPLEPTREDLVEIWNGIKPKLTAVQIGRIKAAAEVEELSSLLPSAKLKQVIDLAEEMLRGRKKA